MAEEYHLHHMVFEMEATKSEPPSIRSFGTWLPYTIS